MIISPKILVTGAVLQFKVAHLLFASKKSKTCLGSNSLILWLVLQQLRRRELTEQTVALQRHRCSVCRVSHTIPLCNAFSIVHPLPFSEISRRTVT